MFLRVFVVRLLVFLLSAGFAGVFFCSFAFSVLVSFLYTSCMLRGALCFFNDISMITYQKESFSKVFMLVSLGVV